MQQMPGRDAYLDRLLRADFGKQLAELPELQREVRCDFDLIIGENVSENQSRASRYFCEHLVRRYHLALVYVSLLDQDSSDRRIGVLSEFA